MKRTILTVTLDNINGFKIYRLDFNPVEDTASFLYRMYHKMEKSEKSDLEEMYAMEIKGFSPENQEELNMLSQKVKEGKLLEIDDKFKKWYIPVNEDLNPRVKAEKIIDIVKDRKQVYLEILPTNEKKYFYDRSLGGVEFRVKINETVPKIYTLKVQTGLNREGEAYRIWPADRNSCKYKTWIESEGKSSELSEFSDKVFDKDFWNMVIDDVIPREGFSRYDYGRMISYRSMLAAVESRIPQNEDIYIVGDMDGNLMVTLYMKEAVKIYVRMLIDGILRKEGKLPISEMLCVEVEKDERYKEVGLSRYVETGIFDRHGKNLSLEDMLTNVKYGYGKSVKGFVFLTGLKSGGKLPVLYSWEWEEK